MKYVKTITNAFYDYGERDYIEAGKILEVYDNFYDTKIVVLDNGFKRILKKSDVKEVYVLLVFQLHQKIRKFYVSSYNISKLDYYLMPRIFIDYDEMCLKEYKEMCLKVLNDDFKRALRCALKITDTIRSVNDLKEALK